MVFLKNLQVFKDKPQHHRLKLARSFGIWTVIALAGIHTAFAQSPPSQPLTGPGGSQAQFTVQQNVYGTGGAQFWIYTPQPLQAPAPVVVFMHGYGALNPTFYESWIAHIAKRGNIVIYPRYQESLLESPFNYTDNAIAALRTAFGIIGAAADLNKVAFVGHSLGGVLNFNIAAQTLTSGLPVPKAILSAHPGESIWAQLEMYSQIPAPTMVLLLVGDADLVVGDIAARNMIAAIPQIPTKNFITVQSDYHGLPPLLADHLAPNAPPVNALDYYAYWKLADALIDFAFSGTDGDYALGGGDNQTSMGFWSDGVPVKPLNLRPTVSIPGLVNAASFQAGPIAPGEVVILFGSGLGPKQMQPLQLDAGGRVSKSISGTRVLFQGIPSPLVYAFMNQVAAVVPYGIAGRSSVAVQVESGTYTSAAVTVNVASSAPGIFAANGSGSGQGTILNQNFSANSSENPAAKGSQIIIYATGEGELNSIIVEGSIVTTVVGRTKLPVSVTIAGVQAEVTYAGDAPGFFAGILQVNVQLPANLPSGDLPVVLRVGGSSSQLGITVAVR